MKTSEHFRTLKGIARTEGIGAALRYDFKETLDKHPKLKSYVIGAMLYQAAKNVKPPAPSHRNEELRQPTGFDLDLKLYRESAAATQAGPPLPEQINPGPGSIPSVYATQNKISPKPRANDSLETPSNDLVNAYIAHLEEKFRPNN